MIDFDFEYYDDGFIFSIETKRFVFYFSWLSKRFGLFTLTVLMNNLFRLKIFEIGFLGFVISSSYYYDVGEIKIDE